jgi:hypothetical protein
MRCAGCSGEATEPPRAFDWFVAEFNSESPHEALSQRTRSAVYTKSEWSYPWHLALLSIRRSARSAASVTTAASGYSLLVNVGHALAEECGAFDGMDDGL